MRSSSRTPARRRLLLLAALLGAGALGCSEDLLVDPARTAFAPGRDVELAVDDLGITHVTAQSDADAFYGAGYAMARDRLFQMELTRRQAFGTEAEILGPDLVGGDIASRTMNFRALGVADAARARAERPEDAALADAWVAGVNRRIDEIRAGAAPRPYGFGPGELDFLPAPWAAADAYAIGKVLSFGLSDSLSAEILATALTRLVPSVVAKLHPLMPAYDTFITVQGAPPGTQGKGPAPAPPAPRAPLSGSFPYRHLFKRFYSNNWAVDGRHTDSGRPLLAGDPHQSLDSPMGLWPFSMSSVAGGGTLDVVGFAFVGTPTVELGHNARLGWTATTNQADVMDLWDVDAGGAFTSVKLGGVTVPIVTRTETLLVRVPGAPVGTTTTQTIDVHDVPGFGVILPDELLPLPGAILADGKLLFDWTGFRPTLEASAYLALDRAADLDGFEAAADLLDVGAVNFVAADATGIDYHVHAAVPDRGDPSTHPMPYRALPGADPAGFWTRGDSPPSRLPHLRNPARGFVVTANNDPFGFTADGDVTNDPYYYSALYDHGFRAHQIDTSLTALLEGGHKVSRADMEALQGSTKSSMADTLLPPLSAALAAVATDPALAAYVGRDDLQQLGARLAAWDRRFDRDQGTPVVFLGLEWFAAQRSLEGALTPPIFQAIGNDSPPFLLSFLHNVVEQRFPEAAAFAPGGNGVLLLAALDDTAAWLVERFGAIDAGFKLGDVQFASFGTDFGHRLRLPPVAVSGAGDTIDVANVGFFGGDDRPLQQFSVGSKSAYRMVVGFAADGTPEATLDFAFGTRGDPDDPHFADQLTPWVEAAHQPLPFRRDDVESRTTERLVLKGGR